MPTPSASPAAVGYVLKVFPRLSETFVVNEIHELERQEVSVRVFSLHSPPASVPHAVLRRLRAPVIHVDSLAEPSTGALRRAATALAERMAEATQLGERLLPRKYVRLALQLGEAVRTHPVRALHAHFASRPAHVTMLASELLGVPFSFTAHAKDIYHRDVDREIVRAEMQRARLVVTVTEFNRRTLLAMGAGLPDIERKVQCLNNGVDLAAFHPDAADQRASRRILAVGRLVEKKGFAVLIRACDILRREGLAFTCDIVGGGEQEGALRALVRELALEDQVRLHGSLPLEAVAAEMRRATLVALPCVVAADGNMDALPTVLLEAMACGLPVVSTALSGIPEIVVDGETGFVVPPGDAAALARALRRLLEDAALATRLGVAGRARAERLFDLRTNVARLRDWLAA